MFSRTTIAVLQGVINKLTQLRKIKFNILISIFGEVQFSISENDLNDSLSSNPLRIVKVLIFCQNMLFIFSGKSFSKCFVNEPDVFMALLEVLDKVIKFLKFYYSECPLNSQITANFFLMALRVEDLSLPFFS